MPSTTAQNPQDAAVEEAEGFEDAGEVTVKLPELSNEADLERARVTIRELRLEVTQLESDLAMLDDELNECWEGNDD